MAERALEAAYTQVMDLEPLSATATATDRESFEESLTRVHRLAAFMHLHTSGLMIASGLKGEEEGEWEEPEVVPIEKPVISPASRVQNIWNAYNDVEAMEADDWLKELVNPCKQTLFQAEQSGFVRLLAGYIPAASSELLYAGLVLRGNYGDIGDRSVQLENNTDTLARLQLREKLMEATYNADALYSFACHVLRTIHAIKFSREWALLTSEQKTAFRNALFRRVDVPEYRVFQHRHERVIKARNDLRKLFNKVVLQVARARAVTDCWQFGARVLLDPCWTPTVSYESSKTGRSPTFPGTLKLLLSQLEPRVPDLIEDEEVLLQILDGLVSQGVMDYIKDFLASA